VIAVFFGVLPSQKINSIRQLNGYLGIEFFGALERK